MTTRAILEAAKRKIEQGGLCKHAYQRDDQFCTIGAIRVSARSGSADEYARALRLIARAVGVSFVAKWNDAEDRTKEDVLAAFDQAIALCDSEVA